MELRGDISGHRGGFEYEFRRTKEVAIWRRSGSDWQRERYVPPGTDDDPTNRDEDLVPENNRIYEIDGPGLHSLNFPLGARTAGADEAVYKGTFVDSVEARVPPGPWARVSNEFQWHSITWLEKTGAVWSRKSGSNEVEVGSIMIGAAPPCEPGDYPLPPKNRDSMVA
jgi:hypothetical protein